MTTELIVVGGFLGAGKTTLLQRAAEIIRSGGKRVGIVTNDQAANLVDTLILDRCPDAGIREVSGGCFCCHFPDLTAALAELTAGHAPDVVLCEPVGSCTDVSATVLQPLKKLHAEQYRLAPFTVLLDPRRAVEALENGPAATLPDHVLYIFRKQIEEADVLVINKADETPAEVVERCRALLAQFVPHTPMMTMSALTGMGVGEWLAGLAEPGGSGGRIAAVDYDLYADGEAALGWLNAAATLAPSSPVNWREFAECLLAAFRERLQSLSAEIAHVKLRLTVGADALTANLTGNRATPSIRGALDPGLSAAQLVFNARVHVAPDQLRAVFDESLSQASQQHGTTAAIDQLRAFAPARPEPTHRFAQVVA